MTKTIASKKRFFSLNHKFLYWSHESPLKVPCRSQMLGILGDLQGMSPGYCVPAGKEFCWLFPVFKFGYFRNLFWAALAFIEFPSGAFSALFMQ